MGLVDSSTKKPKLISKKLIPKCKKCNCEKPLEDFNLRDKEKQIPTTYCKQCNKDKVKAWRKTEEGSKKWKEYQKDKTVAGESKRGCYNFTQQYRGRRQSACKNIRRIAAGSLPFRR